MPAEEVRRGNVMAGTTLFRALGERAVHRGSLAGSLVCWGYHSARQGTVQPLNPCSEEKGTRFVHQRQVMAGDVRPELALLEYTHRDAGSVTLKL